MKHFFKITSALLAMALLFTLITPADATSYDWSTLFSKLPVVKQSNSSSYPERVKAVQRFLFCYTRTKDIMDGSTQDGKFGPKTKAAVIKFQKSKSLSQDGSVGPNTWRAIENTLSPKYNLYLGNETYIHRFIENGVQYYIYMTVPGNGVMTYIYYLGETSTNVFSEDAVFYTQTL